MAAPAETILPRDRTGTARFSLPAGQQTERMTPPIRTARDDCVRAGPHRTARAERIGQVHTCRGDSRGLVRPDQLAGGERACHLGRLIPRKGLEVVAELAKHPGRVLSHEHLLRAVWGPAQQNQTEYLRVAIRALRQKLERDPAQPEMIVNEPAVGYRLVP